jgi:autotransporter-associated beta strand protein
VTTVGATAKSLTLGGANTGANTVSGVIADGASGLSLTKADAGTWILSGANTYTGNTAINGGTLLLNSPGSLAAGSAVTVASAAKLGGTGTAAGSVAVNGTIAAGASIGTLNTGSQAWAPAGTNAVELGTATGTAGVDWDLLNITGDLTITVTNNAPTANKFTLRILGTPGGITNFNKTLSYTWPIATVSGTVYGFNAPKFNLDTAGITNEIAGAFSVVLNGKRVELVYTPTSCTGSTTASAGGTNSNMHMFFVNTDGLASVQALTLSNCVIYGTNYDSAGNELAPYPDPITPVSLTARTNLHADAKKLLLVAVKVDGGQPAAVNVIVMDKCGRGKSFDPIITTLEVLSGNKVQQRFEGLLSAEHYLNVINGSPGLTRLEVNLNGRVFALNLTDGQRVASDLRSAMREGTDNVVILTGYGAVGSSAFVTLTDTPTGNEQPIEEIVRLTLGHGAAGLTLQWPETLEGWTLQASATPTAGWADVTTPLTAVNGQWTLTVPATGSAQFYRLQGPVGRAADSAPAKSVSGELPGTPATHHSSPASLPRTHEALLW